MVVEIVSRDPTQPGEGPREITEDNVQFWSKHARSLEQPHINKARKFVAFDCIRYVGDDNEYQENGSFVCLPLNTETSVMDDDTGREFAKVPYPKDYNSTIYTIVKSDGSFKCNCQGWTYRERQGRGGADGCSCSHVLALFFCFKLKKFGVKS